MVQRTEYRPAFRRPPVAEVPARNGEFTARAETGRCSFGKVYAQHRKGVGHVAAVRMGYVLP